jgi:hypothetical protein
MAAIIIIALVMGGVGTTGMAAVMDTAAIEVVMDTPVVLTNFIVLLMTFGPGTAVILVVIIALEKVLDTGITVITEAITVPAIKVVLVAIIILVGFCGQLKLAALSTMAMVAAIFAHHAGIGSSDIYLYGLNKLVSGL